MGTMCIAIFVNKPKPHWEKSRKIRDFNHYDCSNYCLYIPPVWNRWMSPSNERGEMPSGTIRCALILFMIKTEINNWLILMSSYFYFLLTKNQKPSKTLFVHKELYHWIVTQMVSEHTVHGQGRLGSIFPILSSKRGYLIRDWVL